MTGHSFTLTGIAMPKNAGAMLDEVCEHFVEHCEVLRDGDGALLKSELGDASLRSEDGRLLIELACPGAEALEMCRTMLAEHLFYFAGDDPFELEWAKPAAPTALTNIHHLTVVDVETVTPLMRRVKFACDDVSPFIGGHMHVRLMVPPQGRPPVWPTYRANGRIAWPDGEDRLLVRVYTIRHVDIERRQLWVDVLLHQAEGVKTPGADFALTARPGQRLALLGPGGGDIPDASTMLLVGDETALPAIARIAAEAPAGSRLQAIVEIMDEAEQQSLHSAGNLTIEWLHRRTYPAGATGTLSARAREAILAAQDGTFVWAGCEKQDARAIRMLLKSRKHDRKLKYVAWYWDKEHDADHLGDDD